MPLSLIILLALFAAPGLALAEPLNDRVFHFSLTIPDGFNADPVTHARGPNVIHAWRRPSNLYVVDTLIIIERMNTTLSEQRRDRTSTVEVDARLINVIWKQFQLDAIESPQKHPNGIETIVYEVPIPLKGEAIRLTVGGPLAQKEEIRNLRDSLLASLQGESNWRSAADVANPIFTQRGMIITVVAAVIVIAAILVLLIRFSRRATHIRQ